MTKKSDKSEVAASGDESTFEEALVRLETIVSELEDGQLGLSAALERYEQGVAYLRQCYEALSEAERKVELITGVDADGNPIVKPFDDRSATGQTESSSEDKPRRRARPKRRSDLDAAPQADIDSEPGLF